MRIGIDATICFSSKPTGLGIYTINVVNELAKLHDDLVVWTVNDAGMKVDPSKVRKVMQPLRFTGQQIFQLRPFWINAFLPGKLRDEKVDVLFTTVPSALTKSPVPHVITVHDLIPLTFPGESPKTVVFNYKYRIPKILRNASALVSISNYTKHDVIRHFNINEKKIHTIHLGYDVETFVRRKDQDILKQYDLLSNEYLLYVGNATPRKNLLTLIRAFSSIRNNVPHKLVLCGSKTTRERNELISLINELDLKKRVMLLDYVPYRDLPVLYSEAALLVYVSLYEGFGLPVLEAMACGTPVVASNTTSLPEVTGDAAVLVDPTNQHAIASAMVGMLSDVKQLQHFAKESYRRSREFSWGKTANELLSLLKSKV